MHISEMTSSAFLLLQIIVLMVLKICLQEKEICILVSYFLKQLHTQNNVNDH